jgi:hypothetical protein
MGGRKRRTKGLEMFAEGTLIIDEGAIAVKRQGSEVCEIGERRHGLKMLFKFWSENNWVYRQAKSILCDE